MTAEQTGFSVGCCVIASPRWLNVLGNCLMWFLFLKPYQSRSWDAYGFCSCHHLLSHSCRCFHPNLEALLLTLLTLAMSLTFPTHRKPSSSRFTYSLVGPPPPWSWHLVWPSLRFFPAAYTFDALDPLSSQLLSVLLCSWVFNSFLKRTYGSLQCTSPFASPSFFSISQPRHSYLWNDPALLLDPECWFVLPRRTC